jgi:hypothetical protein
VNWVRISKAATDGGYAKNTIRMKIQNGVWLHGVIWTRAPDGCIFIDLAAVDKWVEGQAILPP